MNLKIKKFSVYTIVAVLILSLFVLAGCGNKAAQSEGEGENSSSQKEEKGTVKLAYVNWAEGVAIHHLAKAVLEDKMGYDCKLTMSDSGPIYTSIAKGDYDAFLDCWLPVTDAEYMEKFGDKLDDYGVIYENARLGLVVPEYVDIDSIEEMQKEEVKKKFDGEIIGIDAGAGIMQNTQKVINKYNLEGFKLVPGSGPAMTAALKKAIDEKRWIAVTGWKPHWKFARWDLKFLDDPKKVYGKTENIKVMARQGLEEDMPQVSQFLKNMKLNDKQLGGLMGMIDKSDKDTLEVAKKWMNQNEKLVESWIPKK